MCQERYHATVKADTMCQILIISRIVSISFSGSVFNPVSGIVPSS